MIKPLEDKITHLVDRILPYGDAIKPRLDRVRPYGKVDPSAGPPPYAGPFLPAPPHHVTVVSDPAALDEPIVEYSPNAPTAVSIETSPHAVSTATVVHSPNAPESIYTGYTANAPAITVEYSPNAVPSTALLEDPSYVLPVGSNPPPNGWGWEDMPIDVNVKWLASTTANQTQGVIYHANMFRPPWGSNYAGLLRIKSDSGSYRWVANTRGVTWEIVQNVSMPNVQHSPNAPASIDTQPNAPALIEAEQETVVPGSITVEHSPNAPVIDSAEAYDFTAPYLGPWRFEMVAEKQTDYVAVLVPLAYADDPNVGNYPDGFELEILKVQEYMSSVAQGVIDLVKTDDGLIGGTEQAQVFEMSDRGISWQYADIAQDPTAVNYSLYRGLARPPAEPASVSVEHSPNALSTVDSDTEPLAPSLVESGLLPEPVQSIDVETRPFGITSISIEHSPNAPTIDKILYQEPNPVQSVTAEELFPPNAVASVNSSILPAPNQVSSVSVEVSPNAPASLLVGHLPAQPSVITANTPPLPVALVDAQTEPVHPAQITSTVGTQAPASITAEYNPNAPTVVTAGEVPNAPTLITAQATVAGVPIFPASITVENSPNAPTVDSIAYMQTEPAQPALITSEALTAPAQPTSITSTHNPNAPQVVTSGQPPLGVGQVTAVSSPAQPSSVTSEVDLGLWTPSADSNTFAWWDANDSSTITLNTGVVTEWRDKISSTALTPASSGTFAGSVLTGSLNSKDVIDLSSDDHFVHEDLATHANYNGDLGVYIVAKVDVVEHGSDSIISINSNTGASGAGSDFQLDSGHGNQFRARLVVTNQDGTNTTTASSNTTDRNGAYHIFQAIFDKQGTGKFYSYVDGTPFTNYSNGSSYTNSVAFGAGANLHVFSNRGLNQWPAGQVAEVICMADVGDREKVEGYLAHKWGLEGLLDSAHPFKGSAPSLAPAQPSVITSQQSPNAPQSIVNGLPPLPTGSIVVKTGYIGEQRKVTNGWLNNVTTVQVGDILTIDYISSGNGKRYFMEDGGIVWGSDQQYRNSTIPIGVEVEIIDTSSNITSRTGDPTGSFGYGTDDHRIYIFNGTSWTYFNSDE